MVEDLRMELEREKQKRKRQEEDKKDITKVFRRFESHMVGTVNKWVMRLTGGV